MGNEDKTFPSAHAGPLGPVSGDDLGTAKPQAAGGTWSHPLAEATLEMRTETDKAQNERRASAEETQGGKVPRVSVRSWEPGKMSPAVPARSLAPAACLENRHSHQAGLQQRSGLQPTFAALGTPGTPDDPDANLSPTASCLSSAGPATSPSVSVSHQLTEERNPAWLGHV